MIGSAVAGGGVRCKQMSLTCVGSACSAWDILGLLLLTVCVLFLCTVLRLEVALQGNCPKQALGCMPFSDLRFSRSDTVQILRYSTKEQTLGMCFVPFQVWAAWAARCLVNAVFSRWVVHLDNLPVPSCSVSWVRHKTTFSGVPRVFSGELFSVCNPPGICQPSRIPRVS